jgi:Flp pilus assembly protein CpaB
MEVDMNQHKTLGGAFALLLALCISVGAADKAAKKAELTAGYRSMAVTLDSDQVAFTKSGDRVDVMVTFETLIKEEKKELVTATILQNVLVLSVRESLSQKGKSILLVTVNPNEAQYLALSIDGEHPLRVINRKSDDVKMHPMEMASFQKLFR